MGGRGDLRGAPSARGMWFPLACLAVSAFIFNTSEFMPVGLLTDIAGSFSLTEARAGMMISIYAWAVMALSLPLMVAGSRLAPRRLLLLVIGVFLAGQVGSALAPSFPLLVAARLLVAAAHAVFWSIASPLATRIADERHASVAMGMVVTGSSVAMILGMPLGRVIGLALGWRATFACVAAAALVVLALLSAAMPPLDRGAPFTLDRLPQLARNRPLMGLYAVTILFATGYYTSYSYIEPFLGDVAHLGASQVTLALTAFGFAGIVGSALFSRLYDGRRAAFTRIMVAGLAAMLLLLLPAALRGVPVLAVCALWGLFATAANVAFQAEVIRTTDEGSSAVAMSIFSGLFNLGIGCGTAIGGAVVSSAGVALTGPAGGAIALAALAVTLAVFRPARARGGAGA